MIIPASIQNHLIELALLTVATIIFLHIIYTDVRTLRISNVDNILLLILGIGFGFATTNFNWMSHIGAFVLLFAICFSLFHYGLLGGGDTKLIPIMAFWVGFGDLLPFLLIMTVAGGLLAVVVALISAVRTRRLTADAEAKSEWRKKAMPYGLAIGLAGIVFLVKTGCNLLGL